MARGAGRTVRVAVDALADRPERAFSYHLPAELGEAAPGSLLMVPYGHRLSLGYLLAGDPGDAPAELRSVEAVVSAPMLTPDLLALAEEIAAYYRAPLGTTIAAMLPPGLESRLERRWSAVRPDDLPPAVAAAFATVTEVGDPALRRALGPKAAAAAERLRRAGVLRATWSLRPPAVHALRVRVVERLDADRPAPRGAPLQQAILDSLADGERTIPELAAAIGVGAPAALAAA
ncbi:MAG: hypothetical protein WD116_04920, partial [Chloroflexota bacterium]